MTKNIIEQESIDINELKKKIIDNTLGVIPDEKFNQYRLTRGVYGQRQTGSQMIRIKIPFGKLTADQLIKIADVSDKYADGVSHITTRQNIQYHFVKLKNAPKVWEELSSSGLTLREACGNTVRNITASASAGVDPNEPFDVSPYGKAVFEYFLRNPICQDMGRKIKIAFSSNELDSAFTYFNDIGFIPKLSENNQRGFRVVLGGGLGAQSIIAKPIYEFLEEDKIIPFIEAVLRVFDRHGERKNRYKARLKFLIQKIGLSEFMKLVDNEMKANKNKKFRINIESVDNENLQKLSIDKIEKPNDQEKYSLWKKTNVFEQKQKGFFAVYVRVKLGNLKSEELRKISELVKLYAADDIRLTINQGFLLKYINEENLPIIFNELNSIQLAEPGFDSILDITACPGTDTCNLGITNSTGLAEKLENYISEEFPELLEDKFLKIKISGCMNACGQHMAANIGLHGSSIKVENNILPAMQLVLGGGIDPDGTGNIADKIKKIPTKRIPQLIKILLNDFAENTFENEYFNAYYKRLGIKYFSTLVEPLANLNTLTKDDFVDWGESEKYEQSIGVGECAGVAYDAVALLLDETNYKLILAKEALENKDYADSIYHSYSVFINGAKSVLLQNDKKCNTQIGIIKEFAKLLTEQGSTNYENENFEETVLQINKNEPTLEFAEEYYLHAEKFLKAILKDKNKAEEILRK